jgi:hypothetical protein
MQSTPFPTVYRIQMADGACRSAHALLILRVEAMDGVRSATVTPDDRLIVVTKDGTDIFDQLVEVIIRAGLDPVAATVAPLELKTREPVRAMPVQRVSVHVNGGYDPDTIIVSARVPTEISFSEGHECLSHVVFDSLGIEADLEHGGALITLPALDPGRYQFRCGRDVVHGTLIAE